MNRLHLRHWLVLLLFFLMAYIIPLGARALIVPDETRYSEIPREMITTGNWIVPHLDGLRYFEKPVLGYWVHAGALLLFGENNFAVRLPSALAVGLSALLIYFLVQCVSYREEGNDGFKAILAALIFLSCFEVFGVGNTAVLDSLFALFLTASITAFYFATASSPGSRRETGFLLLAGLACGLGFLTKGFLALAVPILSVVPYLIWQRRFADLIRMSWLPILTAVLVALPWSIAIHIREPDFWHFFFWNEHIRRFMANNAQHKQSFWFFFLTAPGMFFPWTFVVPAALPGIRARLHQPGPERQLLKFCLCWLVLPFLFLSLSKGKLLTYILPCFPPFAVLMAAGLLHTLTKTSRTRLFQGGIVACSVLFGIILGVFLWVQIFGFNGFHPYRQAWEAMMVINGLVCLLLFLAWAFRIRKGHDKLLVFGIAPLLLFFIVHYTIPDPTLELKSPGSILELNQPRVADHDIVIADEDSIRAVCWYLRRNDVYLVGGGGELDYGLSYQDAAERLIDACSVADFINQNRGNAVLIARVKNIAKWREELPPPVVQAQSGPSGYVFWHY